MQLVRFVAAAIVASAGVAQGAAPVVAHPVGPSPEQIVSLKGSKASLKHAKQSLAKSGEETQGTRSSVETGCVRERVVLREKLRQSEERASNTGTIAEQLQAQNMQLRGEEADSKRQLVESQHARAGSVFELEHLKDSVRETLRKDWPQWAPQTNQSVPTMVSFVVSSLQVQNSELHALVSNLEATLNTTRYQLQAKTAEADRRKRAVVTPPTMVAPIVAVASTTPVAQDDASDEVAQALRDQNLDLQRQGEAKQLEVKDLQGQLGGLQDDKAHLLTTLQGVMNEATLLRQELATMRKDKDDEIQKVRDEMAQQAKMLSTHPAVAVTLAGPAAQPAATPVAQPPSQPSASQVLNDLVSPPVHHLAAAADPILELANKEAEKHAEVEEMKTLAAAASSESAEPLGSPLSAWDVLPEVPHDIMKLAKPSHLGSWLGTSSQARVGSWSPVDDLDPDATAAAQKAQSFDEKGDSDLGDSVAQLLNRAQSVVSEVGAAS